MNDQPSTAQTLTELGAAIVAATTKNNTAVQVAGTAVQFEPTIEAAVRAFIGLFRSHHNAAKA
jgi:hypothetical protein